MSSTILVFLVSGPVPFHSSFSYYDTLPDFIDYTIDLNVLHYYININLECMTLQLNMVHLCKYINSNVSSMILPFYFTYDVHYKWISAYFKYYWFMGNPIIHLVSACMITCLCRQSNYIPLWPCCHVDITDFSWCC